jgi:hypothetical protein
MWKSEREDERWFRGEGRSNPGEREAIGYAIVRYVLAGSALIPDQLRGAVAWRAGNEVSGAIAAAEQNT